MDNRKFFGGVESYIMYVYLMKNTEKKWTLIHQKMLNLVSKERCEKIMRYHFEEDRILSLYTAILTRIAVIRLLGCSNESIIFGENEKHKPILLKADKICRPDLFFNYSHTRNAVLLGVSRKSEIGVDIEKVSEPPLHVMEEIFHPEEIDYVNHGTLSGIATRFYEIWTKKEAYTKYLGIGLVTELISINTLKPPISNMTKTWCDSGYVCSVCSK